MSEDRINFEEVSSDTPNVRVWKIYKGDVFVGLESDEIINIDGYDYHRFTVVLGSEFVVSVPNAAVECHNNTVVFSSLQSDEIDKLLTESLWGLRP